jgi:hypothetical protein
MGVVDQSVSDYENGRVPAEPYLRLERLADNYKFLCQVFEEGGPSPRWP